MNCRKKSKPKTARRTSLTRANPFALPTGLQTAGDPIDGNPFPADRPEHRVWQEATLHAEEELCRINSEFQKIEPAGNEGFTAWMKKNGPAWIPEAHAAWAIHMCIAKFNVWAKRSIQIVWSENALREYDQWLFRYAQAWIDSHNQARHLSESSLLDLRSKLIGRMEWWKAEARRYLSEQGIHAAHPPNSASAQNDVAGDAMRTQARNQPACPGLVAKPKQGGRPRKDGQRTRLAELKAANESWKEITKTMSRETGETKSLEAWRSLYRSSKKIG